MIYFKKFFLMQVKGGIALLCVGEWKSRRHKQCYLVFDMHYFTY